jgi:hypothetical protein
VKADTLPLTAWQIGMYGFMAIAYFLILHDADCDALPVGNFLSRQLVAHSKRPKARDVGAGLVCV